MSLVGLEPGLEVIKLEFILRQAANHSALFWVLRLYSGFITSRPGPVLYAFLTSNYLNFYCSYLHRDVLQRPLWQVLYKTTIWLLPIMGPQLGIQEERHYGWNTELLRRCHLSPGEYNAWVKTFRIIPEFRILRLTFHWKSASKCWILQVIIAFLIWFLFV